MSKPRDFLVEIGTEELPPKALRSLMEAFGKSLEAGIDEARLDHGDVHAWASPRRLTVLVENLVIAQDDRKVEQKGPPVSVAFDDDGQAKPAATAFAEKCGVTVDELERVATDKGEWLVFNTVEEGRPAAEEALEGDGLSQASPAYPSGTCRGNQRSSSQGEGRSRRQRAPHAPS